MRGWDWSAGGGRRYIWYVSAVKMREERKESTYGGVKPTKSFSNLTKDGMNRHIFFTTSLVRGIEDGAE